MDCDAERPPFLLDSRVRRLCPSASGVRVHCTQYRARVATPPATPDRVIDLHSHLLPGVDDGARDLSETVAIARSMAADGVCAVAATPHVRYDWPTTPEEMEQALAVTRAAVQEAGVALDVLPGAEIALEELERLDEEARSRFGLGGNPRLLLLEFPYWAWPLSLAQTLRELRSASVVPVIAHPERNADVQENPKRLRELVEAGAFVQLTAASVDGRLGKKPAACARALLELGLAHLVASDAHAPTVRQAGLSGMGRALADEPLGRWLTEDVPRALIAGADVPERPVSARRRRFRR
jgi:protein-tyrosine phosphatase